MFLSHLFLPVALAAHPPKACKNKLSFLYASWNEWIEIPQIPERPRRQEDVLPGLEGLNLSQGSLAFRCTERSPVEPHVTVLNAKIAEMKNYFAGNMQHPLLAPLVLKRLHRFSKNLDKLNCAVSQAWNQYPETELPVILAESLLALEARLDEITKGYRLFCDLELRDADPWVVYGWAMYTGVISFLDLVKHLKGDYDSTILLHLTDAAARIRNPNLAIAPLPEEKFTVEAIIKSSMAPMLFALREKSHPEDMIKILVENLLDSFKAYFATQVFAQGKMDELIKIARLNGSSIIFFRQNDQRFKLIVGKHDFDLFIRLSIPFTQQYSYVGQVTNIKSPSDWWNLESEVLVKNYKALNITPVGPFFRAPIQGSSNLVRLVASRLNEYHRDDRHQHQGSDICWLESALKFLLREGVIPVEKSALYLS